MEMLILFGIVGVPLIALALFAQYKVRQEERKEKEAKLKAYNLSQQP